MNLRRTSSTTAGKSRNSLRESEGQRKFVADELPGLTVDALRRAEQCRAKKRIGRLAKILSHPAEVGSNDGPGAIEEMMATATGLSDAEVLIIQFAQFAVKEYKKQTGPFHQGPGCASLACRYPRCQKKNC